jgi:hypothetical protein
MPERKAHEVRTIVSVGRGAEWGVIHRTRSLDDGSTVTEAFAPPVPAADLASAVNVEAVERARAAPRPAVRVWVNPDLLTKG